MHMKKRLLALALACALALPMVACSSGGNGGGDAPAAGSGNANASGPAGQVYTIQYAHNQTENSPQGVGVQAFKEKVEELSNGQIQVQIFPNGQLGALRELIENCQSGIIQMTQQPTSMIANFVPEAMITDLPYLFDSEDHMWQAMQGEAGAMITEKLEAYNMVNLGYMHGGAKVFTSSKPLASLADFKGQQLRAMETPIVIDTFEALGASAIPLNFSELYNALQQHVVDGQENPNQTCYMNHYYEVQDYCIETNHAWMIYGNIVNKDFWDSLTPELQQNMRDAMAYACGVERETMNGEDAMYKQTAIDNGMQFADLTDAQLQEIKDATKVVWEKEKALIGEEFYNAFLEKVDQYR